MHMSDVRLRGMQTAETQRKFIMGFSGKWLFLPDVLTLILLWVFGANIKLDGKLLNFSIVNLDSNLRIVSLLSFTLLFFGAFSCFF